MGQYYTAYLFDPDTEEGFVVTPSGMKLMEHAYFVNHDIDSIMRSITSSPKHVWWVGDYAEEKEYRKVPIKARPQRAHSLSDTPLEFLAQYAGKFLVNLTKHRYIDLESYCDRSHMKGIEYPTHPLPLLTAVGNGKGGGDYDGTYMNLIGTWAGDLLYATDDRPDETVFKADEEIFVERQ